MAINCPHCQNVVDMTEADSHSLVCTACGGSFRVRGDAETVAHMSRRLGKFEILERVGVGAFGAVWKARDLELGRIVALKSLHASLVEAKADRERFFREARTAAQLRHPGIVMVHEVTELEGVPAIVADFIEGVTLKELLQTRRLTIREAAGLVSQIAEALDYAHSMRLVHRDIKPANVMLEFTNGESLSSEIPALDQASYGSFTSSSFSQSASSSLRRIGPRALLLDFGLALRDDVEVTLTADGQVLGTPAYMSPEQAAGQSHKVDRRSDIYSLGVVLYELLTGEVPFRGSKVALIHQVLNDEPRPPRRINHTIPRDLETICLKSMSKVATQRYATARELADDLRRFLIGAPIQARSINALERLWRWCLRNPLLAGVTAMAALLLVTVAAVSALAAIRLGEAARTAEDLRHRAELARQEALKHAEENRDLLVQQYIDNGVSLMDEYDPMVGLLWFTEAMRHDADSPARQRVHRIRVAMLLRHCPKLLRMIFEDGPVVHARFNPDGRRVITASLDQAARLWDLSSGDPVALKLQHGGGVNDVCFSPQGNRVATASDDRTARIWDAATAEPTTPPLDHSSKVVFVTFSPDGTRVATAARDGSVRLWNAVTGQPETGPLEHPAPVKHASFSPDGQLLVTASDDGTARIWSTTTAALLGQPLKHASQVTCAWFSLDGSRVITAGNDYNVHFWNTDSGELLRSIAHEEPVKYAALSRDGQRLFTISGSSVHVLDADTGVLICPVLKQPAAVLSAQFSPDGRWLATACDDGKVRIWDTHSGRRVAASLPHAGPVYWAEFNSTGRQILTASHDGTARLWDLASGESAMPVLEHEGHVVRAVFSPDSRRVVTASNDNTVRVWDTASGQPVLQPLRHEHAVQAVSFSPNGRTIASAAGQRGDYPVGQVYLWNAANAEPLRPPLHHGEAIQSVEFSPDGQRIVTGCWDGTARVWDIATGEQVARPFQHELGVYHATFSPDGRLVATAGFDGTARVWDAITGQAVTPVLRHECPGSFFRVGFNNDGARLLTSLSSVQAGRAITQVWDVTTGEPTAARVHHSGPYALYSAFTPDGRRFVAATGGSALIRDTESGEAIGRALEHAGMVQLATFSPDGLLVLTASWDRTARVWDAASGSPVSLPLEHRKEVWHAGFSPDGRRIVTASADETARVWSIDPEVRSVDDLQELTQLLSARRLGTSGAVETIDRDTLQTLWSRQRAKFPGGFSATAEEIQGWHQKQAASTR